MASPFYRKPATPPGLYRAARALRRLSTIALVVLIVFVGFVAYSATQIVKAHPQVGSATVGFESNDTVGIVTSFSLNNPTYFAIQHFALHFLVLNDTDVRLVDSTAGPATIGPGRTASLPVELFVPVDAGGASLLTENQNLEWNLWGNASYAYLFTVSVGVESERAWGAPFDNLSIAVGHPMEANGQTEVPVTIGFVDDASFADAGTLEFQVVPPTGADCAQGSFALDVPAGSPYDETENVGVPAGCDPAGGHVSAEFVDGGTTVPLPSEAIP